MSGTFNRCPICSTSLSAGDDESFGDMVCPRCDAPIWFVWRPNGHRFWVRPRGQTFDAAIAEHKERLMAFIAPLNADSMDMVEIVLEMEEWSDRVLEEAQRRDMTPQDVVAFIRARLDRFIQQFE